MPYIDHDQRHCVDYYLMQASDYIETPGQLNFAITRLIVHYLKKRAINYTSLNEVVGVLECAKQELYRRVIVPYEENKKLENGDVF